MKVIKCSLLVLLLPMLVMAGNDGEKVDKKISREFSIQPDGRVELYNRYGSMDIAIGTANHVKIDIIISVTAGTEKKAQDALDKISVDFEEGTNRVRATTEIAESSTGWTNWFNTGKIDMDIHYQVLVPADVFLDLTNKYGDIYLETTDRDISIDLAYGEMKLGDINGKLDLDMAYSEGNMSQIGDGQLNLAYSDLEMEDAKNIHINMKYTDVEAGTFADLKLVSAYSDLHSVSVGDMEYTGKYDDIEVEQIKSINAQTGYSDIKVRELHNQGNFDMRYGDLQIENISRGFSRLDIKTSYTGVNLEFKPDASFSIDAETNYCEIQHSGLKVTENVERPTSRTFKASRGNGSGQIVVRMNYGELIIE